MTHRRQQQAALLAEARRAAIELFHLAGGYLSTLERAREDHNQPVPNTEGRDWLVAATSVEVAMFSLPGSIGPRISHDIGEARRALEALNGGVREAEAFAAALSSVQALVDDLADWLMQGRHLMAPRG